MNIMQPPTIKRHPTSIHLNHLKSLLSLLSITLIISRPLLWTSASAQPPPEHDAPEINNNDAAAITNSDEHAEQRTSSSSSSTTSDDKPKSTDRKPKPKRITLLGLDDILQLERSGIVGLGSHNVDDNNINQAKAKDKRRDRLNYQELHNNDMIEDGFYDPFAADPSCLSDDQQNEEGEETKENVIGVNCWQPPESTMETEYIQVWEEDDEEEEEDGEETDDERSRENQRQQDEASAAAGLETLAWGYGGDDPDDSLLIDDDDEEEEEEDDGEEDYAEADKDADDQRDDVEQQPENVVDGSDGNQECTAATDDFGDNEDDEVVDSGASPSTDADADTEVATDKDKPSTAAASSKKKPKKKKKDKKSKTILVDKHWGTDEDILKMRDRLRGSTNTNTNNSNNGGNKKNKNNNQRPPVFLLPGLASTRLVSWKHKPCPQSPLLSDIKMLDHVWLNMNLLIQMATIDVRCWSECMTLGRYQSDYDEEAWSGEHGGNSNSTLDDAESDNDKQQQQDDGVETTTTTTTTTRMHGCKLRPDEGLDSISSLAPGSISSNLLVGGTNTVYAWLIQWLADNLGYDVTSIVALPYDWRLSPDKMQSRDGFLTLMRKKIEAAVESNGMPGIMVAHSMGNSVFRYFLEWLRVQMQNEAYARYAQQAEHAIATAAVSSHHRGPFWRGRALYRNIVGGKENNTAADEDEIFVDFTRAAEPNAADKSKSTRNNKESRVEKDEDETNSVGSAKKYPKLWELAKMEGDSQWIDWLGKHVWTYVGLAAPLLGAPGVLRSVLSGENMGLPFTHEEARLLELSFGSTSTVNPIPTKLGFCDDPNGGEDSRRFRRNNSKRSKEQNRNLACLDELVSDIEARANATYNPWQDYPALRLLLKDRVDYDSAFPMIRVEREFCDENEKSPCANQTAIDFSAQDVMNGNIFDQFSNIWKEEKDPLGVKLEQLQDSWWKGNVPNMLESTPERPHIKHVVMAYGTDVPTEAGYIYKKIDRKPNPSNNNTKSPEREKAFDGVPEMYKVIWEEKHGRIIEESMPEPSTFTESILFKKKQTRRPFNSGDSSLWLHHSGDGTISYLSLMWAHTWLLHATRAMRSTNHTMPMLEGERISNPHNALDSIKVSHRPKGGNDWIEGYGADPRVDENYDYSSRSNIGDTGTSHPHGTKYKPKMVRFQSEGKSRSTGMEYTTTVIEAIGVEHKETTRNYDILAAAFTDVLKNLNEDYWYN